MLHKRTSNCVRAAILGAILSLLVFPQAANAAPEEGEGVGTGTVVLRTAPEGFTQKFTSSGRDALRWPCRPLRWSMRSSELRHSPALVAAIRSGIAEVQRASGLKFREVKPRMGFPSLVLEPMSARTEADNEAELLSYADLRYEDLTGLIESATVEFHLDRLAPRMEGDLRSLKLVVVHELGHVLGLAHSDDPASVMYYRLARVDPPEMSAADRAGFRAAGRADCW